MVIGAPVAARSCGSRGLVASAGAEVQQPLRSGRLHDKFASLLFATAAQRPPAKVQFFRASFTSPTPHNARLDHTAALAARVSVTRDRGLKAGSGRRLIRRNHRGENAM